MRNPRVIPFLSARADRFRVCTAFVLLAGCAGSVPRYEVGANHPASPEAAVAVDGRTATDRPESVTPAATAPMAGHEHHGADAEAKKPPSTDSAAVPAPRAVPSAAALQQRLDDTVAAYLTLQRGLAKDDLPAAAAAASTLRAAADALAKDADGDTRAAAQKLIAATPTAADRIDVLREAFKSVSAAAVDLVHAKRPSRAVADAVRVAYCPMAKASWLQTEPGVSNPYFGAEMPTCGSIRETLDATDPAKGGK